MVTKRYHLPSLEEMRRTPHPCLAEGLRSANRAITKRYAEYLRDADVGAAQFSLLMRLYYLGEVSMTKLANQMETDRTTMARNVTLLERNGHVEITEGEDKRSRKIRMTDKGFAALEQALPLWQKAQQDLQQILGQDLWANLLKEMRTLVAVEPRPRNAPPNKKTAK
jgi:DNA-binding MarR family transcriptional regulator